MLSNGPSIFKHNPVRTHVQIESSSTTGMQSGSVNLVNDGL